MKLILHRYVLKEQLLPVCVSSLGLSMILITGRLMQISRYLFTSSITVADFAALVLFAMPKLVPYILSMGTLIGVLMAFVRLSSDNELIAMRSAGIGFRQFLPPVLAVVLLSTIFSLCVTVYALPDANRLFMHKLKSVGKASIPAILREGTFIDTIPNLVFFFQRVDTPNLDIRGVFIQDERQPDVRATIVAESATIIYQQDQSEVDFKIYNGVITRVGDNLKDSQVVSFKVYDLKVDFDEIFGDSSTHPKGKREMSLRELYEAQKTDDSRWQVRYALEFHQRMALPAACFFLGLLAAPLGALFRQGSRLTGITLGIGSYLVYYVILSAGKGFGENGLLPPMVGIWMPNLFTASLALLLWIKVDQEKPSRLIRGLDYLHSLIRDFRKGGMRVEDKRSNLQS